MIPNPKSKLDGRTLVTVSKQTQCVSAQNLKKPAYAGINYKKQALTHIYNPREQLLT